MLRLLREQPGETLRSVCIDEGYLSARGNQSEWNGNPINKEHSFWRACDDANETNSRNVSVNMR